MIFLLLYLIVFKVLLVLAKAIQECYKLRTIIGGVITTIEVTKCDFVKRGLKVGMRFCFLPIKSVP